MKSQAIKPHDPCPSTSTHHYGPQGPILGHLSLSNFAIAVHSATLVSRDLVVVRNHTEVLLGQRNNRLAKGYWFVPGGRFFKNKLTSLGPIRSNADQFSRNDL